MKKILGKLKSIPIGLLLLLIVFTTGVTAWSIWKATQHKSAKQSVVLSGSIKRNIEIDVNGYLFDYGIEHSLADNFNPGETFRVQYEAHQKANKDATKVFFEIGEIENSQGTSYEYEEIEEAISGARSDIETQITPAIFVNKYDVNGNPLSSVNLLIDPTVRLSDIENLIFDCGTLSANSGDYIVIQLEGYLNPDIIDSFMGDTLGFKVYITGDGV